jgi:hypothetical protein
VLDEQFDHLLLRLDLFLQQLQPLLKIFVLSSRRLRDSQSGLKSRQVALKGKQSLFWFVVESEFISLRRISMPDGRVVFLAARRARPDQNSHSNQERSCLGTHENRREMLIL